MLRYKVFVLFFTNVSSLTYYHLDKNIVKL
jgi:hypothetical protein